MNNIDKNRKIIYVGILAALAFLVNLIEIPYIVPFLKFDLSEVIILLALIIGFKEALEVIIIRGILLYLVKPGDLIGISVLLIGSIVIITLFTLFQKKIQQKISLIITLIIFSLVMTFLNYFIILPFYTHTSFMALNQNSHYLWDTVVLYLPFNLLKSVLIFIFYLILQKRIKFV